MWNSISPSAWLNRFFSLSAREQNVLFFGFVALLIFIVMQTIVFPINNKLGTMTSLVNTKEKDLSDLNSIVAAYKALKKEGENLALKKDNSTNLFSVLEKAAATSGLMDKLDYMKPGSLQIDGLKEEKWVEIKLSGITLEEMTIYLYNLRSIGKGIYVKRLSARTDGDYVNLILQPAILVVK